MVDALDEDTTTAPAPDPVADWSGKLGLADLEKQHGLPSGLLTSVMRHESAGNPNARSKAGASGLYQFMPDTAKQYGIDPTDPQQSAEAAAKMYGELYKKYEGDLPSALAGYNWGQGNVDRKGLANAPKETRDYIARITGDMQDANYKSPEYAGNEKKPFNPLSWIVGSANAAEDTQDLSKYTDEELAKYASGDNSNNDLSQYSDEELAKYAGEQENAGVSTLTDIAKSGASALARSPVRAAMGLGDFMNAGVQGLARVGGAGYEAMGGELSPEVAKALTNMQPFYSSQDAIDAVAPTIQKETGANINYQPQTTAGKYTAAGLENIASGFGPKPFMSYQSAAAMGLGSQAGHDAAKEIGFSEKGQDVAGVLGGALGAVKGPEAIRKVTQPAANSFAESSAANKYAKATKDVLPETQNILADKGIDSDALASMSQKQIADTKNHLYADGVFDNIKNAETVKRGIYDMADEVGNTHSMVDTGTKSSLDNLFNKYTNDPAYDKTPLVSRLGSWKNMFSSEGEITPTRLNDIKKQVNDAYNENPKSPEGKVYSEITKVVNNALDGAKQQFPNWGKLIDTANDANHNIAKSTQEDTTFTQKYSEDTRKDMGIVKNKTNNRADYKGDTHRQINDITNVQDEPQLQKMMSFVPRELQGQYLHDVMKNASSAEGIKTKIKAAYNIAKGNMAQAAVNIAKSLPKAHDMAAWEPDAATHISDRIQQWKEAAGEAYANHLAEQQQAAGTKASQRYNNSRQQKLLPAPPVRVDKMGNTVANPRNAATPRDTAFIRSLDEKQPIAAFKDPRAPRVEFTKPTSKVDLPGFFDKSGKQRAMTKRFLEQRARAEKYVASSKERQAAFDALDKAAQEKYLNDMANAPSNKFSSPKEVAKAKLDAKANKRDYTKEPMTEMELKMRDALNKKKYGGITKHTKSLKRLNNYG